MEDLFPWLDEAGLRSLLPDVVQRDDLPPAGFIMPSDLLCVGVAEWWALQRNYGVYVRSSTPNKLRFACCQDGIYVDRRLDPAAPRVRPGTSSKKAGCKFGFYASSKKAMNGQWQFTSGENLKEESLRHSCDTPDDMRAYPSARRLTDEEDKKRADLLTLNVPVRKQLDILKSTNPSLLTTPKDLANLNQKQKKARLAGSCATQTLVNELPQRDYVYEVKTAPNNNVTTHILFAHKESVMLARQYCKVVVLDCTYKTNKYNEPLMNVVGIDCHNKSFNIGFAFIVGERETDFDWVLDSLNRLVFYAEEGLPPIRPKVVITDNDVGLMNSVRSRWPTAKNNLCRFHVEMNVAARIKVEFKGCENTNLANDCLTEWSALYHMRSEDDLIAAWTSLTRSPPTRQVQAAGQRAEDESIGPPIGSKTKQNVFKSLKGKISNFAIARVAQQYDLMIQNKHMERPCQHILSTTMGLPCAHKIAELLASRGEEPIRPADFDKQWHMISLPLKTGELLQPPIITIPTNVDMIALDPHVIVPKRGDGKSKKRPLHSTKCARNNWGAVKAARISA